MFFLASLKSLSKHQKCTNSIVRAVLEDSQATRKQNDIIIAMQMEQREENRKMTALYTAKTPDINHFFPCKDDAVLERFFDKTDGLYPLKRSEFYNRLMCCVTDKNVYGTSILRCVFTQEYINSHIWPSER